MECLGGSWARSSLVISNQKSGVGEPHSSLSKGYMRHTGTRGESIGKVIQELTCTCDSGAATSGCAYVRGLVSG